MISNQTLRVAISVQPKQPIATVRTRLRTVRARMIGIDRESSVNRIACDPLRTVARERAVIFVHAGYLNDDQ